jgi:pimeloyl-ACP methyl ester carboxylesterase
VSVLLVVTAVVGGLALAGASWQAYAGARDRRRFPPPGRLVDVGGHRLHLTVDGPARAGPTVVLEAGMASMSANWGWVRADLARTGRVVAYDRAGLGWSDRGTGRFDAATSVKELRAALAAAGITPPYVLAGHSYGGLVVRLFAAAHPGEVAGVVLVDASHPDQWAHIPASRGGRTVAFANLVTAALASVGLMRLVRPERATIDGLPPREHAQMRAYLARARPWAVGAAGLSAWRRRSRAQVAEAGGLGETPLVVLSVTEQDRFAAVLTALQAELPGLSRRSRHVTVEGATHYSLVSRCEHAAVVAREIRTVARWEVSPTEGE